MFLLFLLNSLIANAAPATEVQVNLCENQSQITQKINLDSWKKQETEYVYFVDNSQLSFYKSGWVLKVTFNNKFKAKITLKNNDSDADEDKDCEFDLHGDARKWACKLTEKRDAGKVQRAVDAKEVNSLLSDDQLHWLAQYKNTIPDGADITNVFSDDNYTATVEDLDLNLNISKNSTGMEFNEISSRVLTDEKTAQSKLLAYLKEHNIKICADQGPLLTRLKLQSYFKSEKK